MGERRWRVSRLLRGLGGSEPLAARTLAPGAALVVLDDALVPLADDLADLGRARSYRIGPAARDPADPALVALQATATDLALRPLSPVHPRAVREAAGVRLTWIRRTRRDGDAWEPLDVPLSEDIEAYEVDILSGSAVLRTLRAPAPTTLYPADRELADFGAPQAALSLRIAQLSRVAGRGLPCVAIVPVG